MGVVDGWAWSGRDNDHFGCEVSFGRIVRDKPSGLADFGSANRTTSRVSCHLSHAKYLHMSGWIHLLRTIQCVSQIKSLQSH